MLKIISNYHERPILYWHDLTPAEREEKDWIDTPERQQDAEFFRYKGWVYCLDEFTWLDGPWCSPGHPFPKPWENYLSDSFFSGILFYYPKDDWGDYVTDYVVAGWYCS